VRYWLPKTKTENEGEGRPPSVDGRSNYFYTFLRKKAGLHLQISIERKNQFKTVVIWFINIM